ncbi:hypothetical protein TYM08_P0391 [Marinicellulosiphila megalodicopiae]
MLEKKDIGKPYAGEPHVRFDEGRLSCFFRCGCLLLYLTSDITNDEQCSGSTIYMSVNKKAEILIYLGLFILYLMNDV